MEWDTTYNRWRPFTVGLFGFKENDRHNGFSFIGGWNTIGGDSEKIQVKRQDKLDFHWTTDTEIPSAQSASGWSGTSMFFLHKWGADDKDNITNYSNPGTPQNNANVYSYPSDITGKCIRI